MAKKWQLKGGSEKSRVAVLVSVVECLTMVALSINFYPNTPLIKLLINFINKQGRRLYQKTQFLSESPNLRWKKFKNISKYDLIMLVYFPGSCRSTVYNILLDNDLYRSLRHQFAGAINSQLPNFLSTRSDCTDYRRINMMCEREDG